MQVVVGSRQTGKSTMIAQALRKADVRNHFVSADDAIIPSEQWLRTEWQQARNEAMRDSSSMVLIVDEVQKIPSWPRVVKSLYDADQRTMSPLKVILSGSSSLLLHKGLEDSLMGRYELIRSPHWSLAECTEAFGFTLDDYLYYGGYPGAARFAGDDLRWGSYMRDAIIEPTISQDVLALEDVRKPALMRALFRLGATYSAQELSYTKMLGQLQDAGNTVTLAHYLDLLSKAGMICGLDKYSDKELARRKSSPRLMVYDTSLISAVSPKGRDRLLGEPDIRGRIVESSVGARLLARSADEGFEVMWWREGVQEVDFVLRKGSALTAVEVKSGAESGQSGMGTFLARHPDARRIVVGGSASGACTVKDFLLDGVPLF
ncbi:putative AAA+ superfamily ATPase [Olsenella profusa DSM 13989]|uniref:ATP-binding protein n=1 Tax=Olsenella profusa TaxID=138595 RepID=UPI00278B02A7|nr:AAA family ATPase [Olsenella profusa]MDP9859654.1 putative AAA+ superfamily ATPase [Olsenella profusa DSM 13989]